MEKEDIGVFISMHNEEDVFCFSSALVDKGKVVEFAKTKGITDNFDEACRIFKCLSENKVYPCHLHNVIDEMM